MVVARSQHRSGIMTVTTRCQSRALVVLGGSRTCADMDCILAVTMAALSTLLLNLLWVEILFLLGSALSQL